MDIVLNASLAQNKILNYDGLTALRQLRLVQNDVYDAFLNFVSGTVPTITAFQFDLRNDAGNTLVSVDSVDSSTGQYPYTFSLPLTSPTLNTSADFLNLKAYLSYTASGGGIESFAPFNVRVTSSAISGVAVPYVSTLNGSFGDVLITGAGNVSVSSQGGQMIRVSGDVSALATKTALNATGNALNGQISFLSTATGVLSAEVSILQGQTGSYASTGNLAVTGANLQAQVSSLASHTGDYYPASNPSGFISSSALAPYATTANLVSTGSALQAEITGASGVLQGQITSNSSSIVTLQTATGIIQNEVSVLQGQTGSYYPRANPSGYLRTGDLTPSVDFVNRNLIDFNGDVSVNWNGRALVDENFITSLVYSSSRSLVDSSSVTSLNWDSRNLFGEWHTNATGTNAGTVLSFGRLTGASGILQTQISLIQSATGGYYLNSNPSGYITAGYVTVASGVLQAQITALQSSGVSTSGLATSGFVTGVSGVLNTAITGLSGAIHKTVNWNGLDLSLTNGTTVVDWGTQKLIDTSSAISALWNDRKLVSVANGTTVDWQNKELIDSSHDISLDWENRNLKTSAGTVTVDYQNGLLYDLFSAANSVDFNNRQLYNSSSSVVIDYQACTTFDNSSATSLDWTNRFVYDTSEIASIDWQNRQLLNSSSVPTLNWDSNALYDSAGNFAVYWENKRLFDGSSDPSEGLSLDWQNRQLISATVPCLNWALRTLIDSSNNTVLDWDGKTMKDSSAGASVDWENRVLTDSSSVSSVNWAGRELVSSGNFTAVDWNNFLLQGEGGANWSIVDTSANTSFSSVGNVSNTPGNTSTVVAWLKIQAGSVGSTETYYLPLYQ